ncbi:putative membrane protein [Mycobacterium simulans]|nr:putative membrane protein [Mycobacterium simulans]
MAGAGGAAPPPAGGGGGGGEAGGGRVRKGGGGGGGGAAALKLYAELIDLLDMVVDVDILSGTSAGGINAVRRQRHRW